MIIANTIIWIIAYTSILLNITFFSILYSKYKLKMELAFNITLFNILFIAIVIMVLNNALINPNVTLFIIMNSVSTLFFTIPFCFYYAINNFGKKYYFLLIVTFIAIIILQNIIISFEKYYLIGIVYGVGYLIILLPLFLNRKKNVKKGVLYRQFNKMGMVCFFIFLGFFIPSIFLYKYFITGYLISIYFGIFYIAYQLPGLLYCKKRFFNNLSENTAGLSVLTKRENEVALEICNGLKYEAIAEKLFISLSAVKKHAYNIYQKLDIHNNRELIMIMNREKPVITDASE